MERERIRCAIYTRKSSEEGLSQSFNSLHAQREYCEAYVRSQGGEGWSVVRQRYEDGGFSGANMSRPGLARLLADIDAKLVDAVVVYKVDRLTRSLADFARILERLDQQHVAFVSVTQAFNTSNSMGRLTLNILLSFAQFERDVTGERIRDKIAASKAKGMWMGGVVPLGYDPPDASGDRRLQVNEDEAVTVRSIFERLTQCRSIYDLQQQLMEEGIRSKAGRSRRGIVHPGMPFSRGALRHLLQNKIYIGLISHKGETYAGRHQPIVDQATFDAVQALLSQRSEVWRRRAPNLDRAPLQGRLFDQVGQSMKPVFTRRKGRAYGYYVAPRPHLGLPEASRADAINRVPCRPLDDLIRRRLAELVSGDVQAISTTVLRDAVARVEVHSDRVQVVFSLRALGDGAPHLIQAAACEARLRPGDRREPESRPRHVRGAIPVRLKLRGGRTWVEDHDRRIERAAGRARVSAIRRLRAAHAAMEPARPALASRTDRVFDARKPQGDLRRTEWAFLAPDIQAAILRGRLDRVSIARLQAQTEFQLSWSAQRRLLEPNSASGVEVVSTPTSPTTCL